MKTYNFLLLMIVIGLISCSEDDLTIEPQDPKYDLSDSDTDALQHYKHVFYNDYNVIIIDQADSSDYQYTISSSKLDLKMVKSTLSDDEKIALFTALENTFYGKFAKDFVKEYAPLRLIIADTIYEMEKINNNWVKNRCPYYIGNSLLAVSTNENDFKIEDGIAYAINNYGENENIGEKLFGKIVIENILITKYGEKWDQLFLNMFGLIKPYLSYSSYLEAYDTYFRINFDDGRYDPNAPDHPLKRPLAEFPGVQDESPMPENQNYEAIEAYYNKLGFPNIRYKVGNPRYYAETVSSSGKVSPAMGRIAIDIEELIPLWVEWTGKYNGTEREAKFVQYPELKKNYLVTKELLKKYADIDI